jgi:hypothetical protein
VNAALHLLNHPALRDKNARGLVRSISRISYDSGMRLVDGLLVTRAGIPLARAGVFEYTITPSDFDTQERKHWDDYCGRPEGEKTE